MNSLSRTALVLLALSATTLPLSGCGSADDNGATGPPAASTAAAPSLTAATTALGAAAMSALQSLKGGVSSSNADAYVADVSKAQAQFDAAVAQVKSAAANTSKAKTLQASILTLAQAASADFAAVIAAGPSDIAALTAAANRLQGDLGAIMAAPA